MHIIIQNKSQKILIRAEQGLNLSTTGLYTIIKAVILVIYYVYLKLRKSQDFFSHKRSFKKSILLVVPKVYAIYYRNFLPKYSPPKYRQIVNQKLTLNESQRIQIARRYRWKSDSND